MEPINIPLDLWETKEWHRSRDTIRNLKHKEAVQLSAAEELPVNIVGSDGYVLETVVAKTLICPTCYGNGSLGWSVCKECHGSGEVIKEIADADIESN